MKVRFSPGAIGQTEAIGAYIAKRSPRAGDEVLAQIRATARILEEHPHSGRATGKQGVRVLTVAHYPYRLLYTVVRSGEVLILSVRHTSRLPPRSFL